MAQQQNTGMAERLSASYSLSHPTHQPLNIVAPDPMARWTQQADDDCTTECLAERRARGGAS